MQNNNEEEVDASSFFLQNVDDWFEIYETKKY